MGVDIPPSPKSSYSCQGGVALGGFRQNFEGHSWPLGSATIRRRKKQEKRSGKNPRRREASQVGVFRRTDAVVEVTRCAVEVAFRRSRRRLRNYSQVRLERRAFPGRSLGGGCSGSSGAKRRSGREAGDCQSEDIPVIRHYSMKLAILQ